MRRSDLRPRVLLSFLTWIPLAAVLASACAESTASTGTCDEGLTTCDGVCTDAQIDPGNCGACGNVCPDGFACGGGACLETCGEGLTLCLGVCIDTQTDTHNCGACNVACPGGTHCEAAACAVGCDPGLTLCDGTCADTDADAENCGGCGIACAPGSGCTDGQCEQMCPPGTTSCGGACVDTQTSEQHCGGCNLPCAAGYTCQAGSCQFNPSNCDNSGECGDGTFGCLGCALMGNCADEYDTCINDIDCNDFINCIQFCDPADQLCFDDCINQFPTGASLYNDVVFCAVCDECPIDCDGPGAGCP